MPEARLTELAERYRPEFPIFERAVYLNTCSLGPLSKRARGALAEFADTWTELGAVAWYEHWLRAADEVRAAFAALIGAPVSEVGLAPSVSAALATISSAIDFRERPRVITTELDFPTLVYQYLAREALGVETVILESDDGIGVPVERFAEAVDGRTALIATSHVYFTTGAIQDVAALSRVARDRGALCLIDAYQSTGQIPVRVDELGTDVLISGALKWLMGGPGLAFYHLRGPLSERLRPTAASWFGVADQFSFDPRAFQLVPDARRFQLGTPSVPTVYTARAGLEMVAEVGIERIQRRVFDLTQDLIGRAREAGLAVRVASRRENRSGIVLVEDPEPGEAVRRLRAAGVIADYRPGVVRLSPHFYNTTEDNEAAVATLAG